MGRIAADRLDLHDSLDSTRMERGPEQITDYGLHITDGRTCMRIFLALMLILTAWTSSPDIGHAQEPPIQVFPSSPTFTDPVSVTVQGRWPTTCTPILQKVSVASPTIRIDGRTPVPPEGCSPMPTEWAFTTWLEPLAPNIYLIEVYIDEGAGPKPYAQRELVVQGGIAVEPRMPTVDETIQLTVAFLKGDACIPAYESHRVQAHLITVETLQPNGPCAQVPTPWSVRVDLGRLLVGAYTVEVYTTVADTDPPQRSKVGGGGFRVVERRYEYYFPFLPIMKP
ncbi:MAG: hypothetical protein D6790_17640 [Caldilineae bacterium]|nr:MAG: hypothetical protein D6790_17640 [Caldilineae bacterium]